MPRQLTLCWTGIFFFASAAASAAYLTVSESFPIEARALAIAFFYAVGTALGGVVSPWLFGTLVGSGERGAVFDGYLFGAGLMIVAALTETRDRHQGRTAAAGKRRAADLRDRRLGKGGRDFGHEAGHLVLDLRMRLQADIEVEDDLVETGRLDLFQRVGDLRRRAEQHRVLAQVLAAARCAAGRRSR